MHEEINDDVLIAYLKVKDLRELIKNELKLLTNSIQSKQPDKTKNDLIPRKDLARFFAVSTVTLDKWVRYTDFPKPIKQGGRVYFLGEEIDNYIKARKGRNNG